MARKRQFGSVRKIEGGRWQVRYNDPLTGRRTPAPHTFPTKADASRWLARLEAGALDPNQLRPDAAELRLGPYGQTWIAERPLKPRTRETYEGQFRLHIEPTIGDARIAKLEPRHIRTWHADLRAGRLSDVTVAKVYRLLRTILNTAVDDGIVASNPCKIDGAGVERSAERSIPTFDQIHALAEALPPRYRLIPWMAALGALRKGEILGLARRHIDLDAGTIRVERALQEVQGEGATFASVKTASSERTVVMPERLRQLTIAHLDSYVGEQPDDLLFTNTHGRPIRATVWTKAWNGSRAATGLHHIRLHDLRHYAGTITAQAGATTKELMSRLGHSSIQAAMRYQHISDQRARSVAERIDDLLGANGE